MWLNFPSSVLTRPAFKEQAHRYTSLGRAKGSPPPPPAPGVGKVKGPAEVEGSPLPLLGPKSFFIADSRWRGCVDNCAGVCVRVGACGCGCARACVFAVGPSQGFTLTKSHYKRFGVVGTEWYLYSETHRQESKAVRANARDECQSHAKHSTFVSQSPSPCRVCPAARAGSRGGGRGGDCEHPRLPSAPAWPHQAPGGPPPAHDGLPGGSATGVWAAKWGRRPARTVSFPSTSPL